MNKVGIAQATKDISIDVYMDANTPLDKLTECDFQIDLPLDDNPNHLLTKKRHVVYVKLDVLISVPEIKTIVKVLLDEVVQELKYLSRGMNLFKDYELRPLSQDNSKFPINPRFLKDIEALTSTRLESIAMALYQILCNYKGSDTYEIRKFQKMVEQVEKMQIL